MASFDKANLVNLNRKHTYPLKTIIGIKNKFHQTNLKSNQVYIDQLILPPLMTHDITITINPSQIKPETETKNYICVSGWPGMINNAGNGIYIKYENFDRIFYVAFTIF